MISFLTDLLAHYSDWGVLLILDHASIHKSRELREWQALHPQIELIYLLRYGGHRDNPVEKLWWHLKGYAAANRCCRSMAELLSVVERYFAQLTPEKVFQLVAGESPRTSQTLLKAQTIVRGFKFEVQQVVV